MCSMIKISHPRWARHQMIVFFVIMFMSGCATAPTCPRHFEGIISTGESSPEKSLDALHSVAEAVSGQDISCQGMADLARDINQNEEAASAVQEITDSLQGAEGTYKYCPVCGKRYHSRIKRCPVHDVLLKEVED